MEVGLCTRAKDEALQIYNEEIIAALESRSVLEPDQLRQVHAKSHNSAVLAYIKQAVTYDDSFQENLKDLNVKIHKAFENFIKANDCKSEEISREFMEICFSKLNKDVENKVFARAGGHKEFLRRRLEATQQYKMQEGLGPMKEVILDQCLTKLDMIEYGIISSDQSMAEAEKRRALMQSQVTAKQEKTEREEKQYRTNLNDVKQILQQHKESINQLKKQQEEMWLAKEREHKYEMEKLKQDLERAENEKKSKEAEEMNEKARFLEEERVKQEELKRMEELRFNRVEDRMKESSEEGLGEMLWKNKWNIFGAVGKAVEWWYS